jgi:Tfp pilus assembly protein PilX
MNKRRRAHPRGWVMIMVLLVLLVMSILVAGFYMVSSDSAGLARIVVGQQVAMSHADTGLQDGLRAVRAAQIPLGTLTPCSQADVDAITCATAYITPIGDNGSSTDLTANGGLQYQYMVYTKSNATDPGMPSNRFFIRSIGYYGYKTTSNSLITSIVEVEVDSGTASAPTSPTTGYGN